MATVCKNCGQQVKFDPASQRVVCNACGSKFLPHEISEYGVDVLEKAVPESVEFNEEDFMDCYVYSCNSCGGEIIVNDTEASTMCVYCGGTSVVYNRIAKQRKPRYIIPFKLTREEAVKAVHEKFKKGFFIPNALKHLNPEDIKGVYVPYWLVDADHYGIVTVRGTDSSHNPNTIYFSRGGYMRIRMLPIDAANMLSMESTQRLEPYNYTSMERFHPSYMLGFYSNISDINYAPIQVSIRERAEDMFNEMAIKDVSRYSDTPPEVIEGDQETLIDYSSLKYVMLPVWFISYRYQGYHNTILVNGETGKVVCGVPVSTKKVYTMAIIMFLLLAIVVFMFNMSLWPLIIEDVIKGKDKALEMFIYLPALVISVPMFAWKFGIPRWERVIRSIRLTQASSLEIFARKRQG